MRRYLFQVLGIFSYKTMTGEKLLPARGTELPPETSMLPYFTPKVTLVEGENPGGVWAKELVARRRGTAENLKCMLGSLRSKNKEVRGFSPRAFDWSCRRVCGVL